MMKRFIFSALSMAVTLLIAGTASTWAKAITPEQAKQVASGFVAQRISSRPDIKRAIPSQKEMQTVAVFNTLDENGQPYLYAVNFAEHDGYVLVSGDDRFTAVLGYCDDHAFDEQTIPENMRAWLQGYIDEMVYLESVNYQPSLRLTSTPKAAVSPLVETLWSQGEPYNNSCPLDPRNQYSCVTGCVATAMAQVVNYHMQHYNAPTSIVTEIEAYTTKGLNIKMDATPAGTALPDKNLLLNSYKGEDITDEQKEAVAQLMLYCGTAVKTIYASGGSSSSTAYIPNALVKYFGFDTTTRLVQRADYTYAAWCDLIYDEVAAARPVCYGGQSSGGGHSFVVDGYDGEGLFHVNWGWGGHDNNYFALSVLNSDDNGQIGASSSSDGYSGSQQAGIGIQINTGQTWTQNLCMSSTIREVNNDNHTITFSTYNLTGETNTFNYGIGFVNEDGSITEIKFTKSGQLDNMYGYSAVTYTVPTNIAFANTTKKVVPISRVYGTTTWYPGKNPDIYYVSAEYDINGVPFLTIHPSYDLQVTSISVPSSKYAEEKQSVKVEVQNNGDEFYGSLFFFVSQDENKGECAGQIGLTALPNSSQELFFDWTPTAAGTYNIWITTDIDGEEVMGSSTVVIKEDASLIGRTLVITDFSFDGYDEKSFQIDEATGLRTFDVYNDSLIGNVTVKNISSEALTDFQFRVRIEEYNEQTGQFERDNNGIYYIANYGAGNTRKLSVKRGPFEVDKTYRLCLVTRENYEYLDDRYIVHFRSGNQPEIPTGFDAVQPKISRSQKQIENGVLIIIRDDKRYNAQGQLIQ